MVSVLTAVQTTQPWFYRDFIGTSTSDIEARLCSWYSFSAASALIDQL